MFEVLKVADHALVTDVYPVDRKEMEVVQVSRHVGRWNPLTRDRGKISNELKALLDKPSNHRYWLVAYLPRDREMLGGGYSFLISDSDLSVFYIQRSK
jgi:hypothetical protein